MVTTGKDIKQLRWLCIKHEHAQNAHGRVEEGPALPVYRGWEKSSKKAFKNKPVRE
jgi:hypothetical protein